MKWTLVYFDDQPANIECMSELLADIFVVVGQSNSNEFQKILEKNNPHLILLDVHMPLIDGHKLYQEISKSPCYNGCPIVFISGDDSDGNKLRSYEHGAVDFLPRDLRSEEIIARLANKVQFYLQHSAVIEVGNLSINMKEMKAMVKGKIADLTMLEMRLLSSILRSPSGQLTRSELIEKIWGKDAVKVGTVNTHLTNLKPKIENWDYQIKIRDENILVKKKD